MKVETGNPAPDFSLFDSEKKQVTLSELRGKSVLLLFFPLAFTSVCTKELCSVRDNIAWYNTIHAQVIGISVDENGERWKKAIKEDDLPWIHISDLKRESALASLFGVQPIPDNFLINPEGIIVAKGLHGNALANKLADLLSK